MKKTLTVNLGGFVYHIDEDAYQLLDNYLLNLRIHFRRESGAEEIVRDMEQRIAELFGERLNEHKQVITLEDVEAIIAQMGRPEELSAEAETGADEREASSSESAQRTAGEKRLHKLYRNPDDKVLGGVASGLAAYMGWDVTWVRLFFLLLLFAFQGMVFVYVVTWIVIPQACTATEKLAMRGDPINVESIGKTVTDGFGKTVTDGFEKVNDYVHSDEPRSLLRRLGEGIVAVAGFLIKALLVFLAICIAPVLFVLLLMCFVLLMVGMGLVAALPAFYAEVFPIIDWENMVFAPVPTISLALSGILLLGIPVIALIHVCMRQWGGWKPMTPAARLVFVILWLLALSVGVFFLFAHPNIAPMLA